MGLIGISSPHWPWFWGPAYPVYGKDDRVNGSALAEARRQGGVNSFVHPVMAPEPFPADGTPRNLPLSLVPEAMQGLVDTIEVACLWSDERGTADAWYRLLDLGLPIAPSAGTDAFSNFYRSMTVGATRVYVNLDGPLTRFYRGLRRGRSFVTTGPFLDFEVGGAGPGEILSGAAGSPADFRLTVISAVPVETVEVLVNGKVVWKDEGLAAPGKRVYSGKVPVPAGGWIAARAHGGEAVWPVMDSYPFAHTGAVWVNEVGSREEPSAAPLGSSWRGWRSPKRGSWRVSEVLRSRRSASASKEPEASSKLWPDEGRESEGRMSGRIFWMLAALALSGATVQAHVPQLPMAYQHIFGGGGGMYMEACTCRRSRRGPWSPSWSPGRARIAFSMQEACGGFLGRR
jgi:hypothetical protein